jgi:hypothetical protein
MIFPLHEQDTGLCRLVHRGGRISGCFRYAHYVVLLRGVLFDLNFQQTDPTVIFKDESAAMKWSSGGSRRAKHIDLKLCLSTNSCQ